jgi:putative DNA primase/helicase
MLQEDMAASAAVQDGTPENSAAAADNVVQFQPRERTRSCGPIIVKPGSQAENVHAAEFVLASATRSDPGRGVYQRGGTLVRFARLAAPCDDDNIERPADTLRIEWAGRGYLRLRLGEIARWLRETDQGLRPCDPPAAVASILAELGDWPNTPPLAGIVEGPTMRPDGSIIDTPGYDAATGLYFDPGDTVCPSSE